MAIKNIVFDFFGVISSEVAPFIFGEVFEEEEAKRLKQEYMEPADHGDITEREMYESLGRLFGRTPEDMEADFLRRAVINRDMVALIERLREKYRVALLSNAQADYLGKVFNREALHGLFEEKIISGLVRVTKPSPEIFKLLLARMGISAGEAVFIDDNPKNVEAARSVGLHGIVFKGVDDRTAELARLNVTI